jgi:hypothetical protein
LFDHLRTIAMEFNAFDVLFDMCFGEGDPGCGRNIDAEHLCAEATGMFEYIIDSLITQKRHVEVLQLDKVLPLVVDSKPSLKLLWRRMVCEKAPQIGWLLCEANMQEVLRRSGSRSSTLAFGNGPMAHYENALALAAFAASAEGSPSDPLIDLEREILRHQRLLLPHLKDTVLSPPQAVQSLVNVATRDALVAAIRIVDHIPTIVAKDLRFEGSQEASKTSTYITLLAEILGCAFRIDGVDNIAGLRMKAASEHEVYSAVSKTIVGNLIRESKRLQTAHNIRDVCRIATSANADEVAAVLIDYLRVLTTA